MPRRKPTSTRQKKADTQRKRAIKRGDVPSPDPVRKTRRPTVKRGPTGNIIGSASDPNNAATIHAARRLQSAFVTLPPKFLEETKALASRLPLPRPIPYDSSIHAGIPSDSRNLDAPELSCPRRPKWRFEMKKIEVEHNEEGMFKKWLDQMDSVVLDWQNDFGLDAQSSTSHRGHCSETELASKEPDAMPRSTTIFERNLEVWRQLWRVTEISQILLVLLDSRCPLIHFPPSLAAYLSGRKIILVLTKVDITGPERAAAWVDYFHQQYPHFPVVQAESYFPKEEGSNRQGKPSYEPHLPSSFREKLVSTIRQVHAEMLVPPEKVQNNPKWLGSWKPSVRTDIDWDGLLQVSEYRAGNSVHPSVHSHIINAEGEQEQEEQDDDEVKTPKFLTIGLIGQPNVGKSSLLNAIFGTNRVRASKTPGKTKHFQTLFWTGDVRLVDCPGLVMPNLVPMEMQVLCGILPISRVAAVPSSIHFAAERIPIEQVYKLDHPSHSLPPIVDKRTWRDGMRTESENNKPLIWTAMDILTSYANLKKWVTAKAGRPDIHRAGNAILRAVAEGRVGWAFWPPGTDINIIMASKEGEGNGIWIPRATFTENETDDESADDGPEGNDENNSTPNTQDENTDEEDEDVIVIPGPVPGGFSRFSALTIEEENSESDG